ncbi:MAG TPA: hypothetical protein VHV08_06180 [Pirellulales bacterium]|nr:hypothetical protein [Pirellulales bacterium]
MTTPRRVIKLGGSLLDWPELVPQLRCWLSRQPAAASVVVVGGGRAVDAVRKRDQRQILGDEAAHWLSIRAMTETAQMVLRQLPEAARVRNLSQARKAAISSLSILEVEPFLRGDAHSADALPCTWDVTSDSIAARVAVALRGEELVLLKSMLPSGPARLDFWSRVGVVDAYFPRAAAGLNVRFVNLRHEQFAQIVSGTSRVDMAC